MSARRHLAHVLLAASVLLLSPRQSSAQVPRFEQSPSVVIAGLRASDVQTRRAAATSLQRAKPDDATREALTTSLLSDPDPTVRQAAALALAKMGPKARPALVRAGICDPDATVRNGLQTFSRRAKLQCHQQPDPADQPATLPALEDPLLGTLAHPSTATRLAAARELTRRRSSRANALIWNMASKDPSWSVRSAAIRMLARSYGQQLLPVLQHTLTNDPDARVREVALEGLAFLRAPATVPWIAASVRAEENPRVQAAGLNALARIGDAAAVEVLLEVADGHKSEDARAAAIGGLATLAAHRARCQPLFARALKQEKSGKVRAAALRALSGDSSSAACFARAERLRDNDAEVRRAVVEQMARCPAQIARPALTTALKEDREAAVRRAAVELLIRAGAAKALEPLGAALARDKDAALRKRILIALAAMTEKERATPLCEAAKNDPDAELRKAAVLALEKLPAEAVVPALVTVLGRDRAVEVRVEAARVLTKYSDASAYQALQRATQDAAPEVRKVAAAGAQKSPAQRAWVEALLPQVIDPNPAVRQKAIAQLCPLAAPLTFRALLLALWTDQLPAVRASVAKCFADVDSPLVDIGLSVAHATDTDGNIIRAVELAQKQRIERQNKLLEKIKSANPDERAQAARELQPSPSKQVREALELLMDKDPDPAVRRAAAVSVNRYQDRRALEKLNARSQLEKDPALRQHFAATYARLRGYWSGAKNALNINTLVQELRSPKPEARVLAAQALGVLRDRRSWQALREAARAQNDAPLRHAAVLALGAFGDQAIISSSARTEPDKAVREALIQLNYLRTATPDKVLNALGSTKADEVRRAVEATMIKQTPTAVPWLVRVSMAHVDADLRETAVRALTLYDQPLARWAVRVAALNDASKRTRGLMWRWAVHVDAEAE